MSKYVICRAVDFFFVLGDILQGKLFVRLQMSCQSPIEFPYYSSTVGRVDVCAHCTLPSEKSQEMLKKYKVVLPVCAQCPYQARKFQNEIQWNNVYMYYVSVIGFDVSYINHFISSQRTDFSYILFFSLPNPNPQLWVKLPKFETFCRNRKVFHLYYLYFLIFSSLAFCL